MSNSYKGLKNRLDIRGKELGEVVSLYKGSFLTRSMDKDQGTLIAISNYSPRINRRYMASVKLVLYIIRAGSLPSLTRNLLLRCPPSN